MTHVHVSGAFDDLRSGDIRFLEEAARLGPLTVALWPDELVARVKGACRFPFDERRYLLEAIRFVERVVEGSTFERDALPANVSGGIWAALALDLTEAKVRFCAENKMQLVALGPEQLAGFPVPHLGAVPQAGGRKRVLVTGCYDWFHSGHVRFFEECSQLGDLYVVVGHDENVRLLKGEGHPLLPEDERRYVVGSCRYVKQALVSSGMGWMDAEPEIARIRPHMYAVNEDGDKPEKRAFCAEHGIDYVVLKRVPKEGLPRRSSTDLRGY